MFTKTKAEASPVTIERRRSRDRMRRLASTKNRFAPNDIKKDSQDHNDHTRLEETILRRPQAVRHHREN